MTMTIRMNAYRCDVTVPDAVGKSAIFEFDNRKGIERGAVCTAMKAHLGLTLDGQKKQKTRHRRRSRKNRHSIQQEVAQ